MGKPRREPYVKRPSPLGKVHLTRPISQAPPTAAGDPIFWKRFSVAVREAENADLEGGRNDSTSTIELRKRSDPNDWLAQQHQKKRNCRYVCMVITLLVVALVTGAAIVGWWFTQGPGRK
ncbi:uncharacterized protein L3040_009025 [Drepanopeziza brunnea f. sp. 'multigermtubi']|uniref:Uncharacterized protein n=1 Tax=Marssonina brunnea f. sp. multigermtubi (strain MB_m1) TaxID=1072389 RepID=K1WLA8_MARBU|nr:uncharacterized protein MBM_08334 [Drepanopeziza brunnea f. sp. 'multigermtubi' MB_m1]EKD13616.1 hypothetical protein MBM_08334 [Drepanopeziza brunnea f. sp. 'multigermtubi' MB_m1]KAJ5032420.1 hypothetical protein L3040_009025 [Drepanopeziza brunnea f. sp. 'multigermtubi']